MKNMNKSNIVITGLGITSSIGQGKKLFTSALMQGRHRFGILQRPGRQLNGTYFLGSEISELSYPELKSKRLLRTASYSAHVALITLNEAWEESKLSLESPDRVGIVIGGSNIQQRHLFQSYEKYKDKVHFIPPTYGISFMDSDLCGICTEYFKIKGLAYTLGGASASGQVALLNAVQAVQTGQVDICIVVGALMDVSGFELQAWRSLGAMGSDRYASEPAMASRPFDKNHDGFIYGESCGAVVIESIDNAMRRNITPYAVISGCAMGMDGNRNPNSSYEGEIEVIKRVLNDADKTKDDIDYINPHGSGSMIGDEIELKALKDSKLSHAFINTTKSITGHGISSAGIVEIIATLLQMKESELHPSLNLDEPIDPSFNWVLQQPIHHDINCALNLSIGFGGINTAVCLQKY